MSLVTIMVCSICGADKVISGNDNDMFADIIEQEGVCAACSTCMPNITTECARRLFEVALCKGNADHCAYSECTYYNSGTCLLEDE